MSLDRSEILKELELKLDNNINKLESLVPDTNSIILKILLQFKVQLVEQTLQTESITDLKNAVLVADRLIHNLEIAKQAAEFASSRLRPTNRPVLAREDAQLEKNRTKLNDTDLQSQFNTLKRKRDRLADSTNNPEIKDFEQDAYRKGTGVNIGMWYRYAVGKAAKKLGNCTEQVNAAFGYLYSYVYTTFSEKKYAPIDRLERIDISNSSGGHCLLLIDRPKSEKFNTKEKYPVTDFLNFLAESKHTCVVVDPWNKEHPYYPAADVLKNLPRCGLSGEANIEFGQDFSEQPHESALQPKLK